MDYVPHPHTPSLVEAWNAIEFSKELFITDLERRWTKNNARMDPTGFYRSEKDHNWCKSLQIYLLSANPQTAEQDGVPYARHAEAMLGATWELLSQSRDFLKFGSVWFEDCLSFRRYVGPEAQAAFHLIEQAIQRLKVAKRPASNSRTYNRIQQVYSLAAHALVTETIERELCTRLFLSEQKYLPFEAFNLFRDHPVEEAFTPEMRSKWAKDVDDMTGSLAEQVIDLYLDTRAQFSPESLGVFRQMFDTPVLLLASSSSTDYGVDHRRFVKQLVYYLDAIDYPYRIQGWQPEADKLVHHLTSFWDEKDTFQLASVTMLYPQHQRQKNELAKMLMSLAPLDKRETAYG